MDEYNKKAKDILMQCTECQFCHNYFLNTWLECVEFIDVQRTFKGMKSQANRSIAIIPQHKSAVFDANNQTEYRKSLDQRKSIKYPLSY